MLLTGYFSFITVRHVPFFVVTALPIAVTALSGPRIVRWARPLVAALGLGAGAFFLPDAALILRDVDNYAHALRIGPTHPVARERIAWLRGD